MALPEPDIKDLQLRTNLESLDQRLAAMDSGSEGVAGGFVPSGGLTMFAGATPPAGWLVCDGSAVSRTDYSRLFSVIGTTWGAGDGSTTFNLPDFRDRALYGAGTAALGATDGNAYGSRGPGHTLTTGEIPAHTHTTSAVRGAVGYATPGANASDDSTVGTTTTGSTGGGGSHNHGYAITSFLIKT